MYYDRQGRSITLAEFAALHTEDYYRVTLAEFGEVSVSTVWLGINHRFGEGPPLIFETLVLTDADHPLDQAGERYATEADAVAGHERWVAKVRAKAAAELAARCPAGCPHPKCPGGSLCCCQPDNGGDRS